MIATILSSVFLLSSVHAAELNAWGMAAKRAGIPVRILHGIALTESGKKWSDGVIRPWPWTLNSPSRGAQFFKSKEAAERELTSILATGQMNVDIGFMQVNCKYHCQRVRSPVDLLDPNVNLHIAGDILAEVHTSKKDMASAVGAYHAGLHPSRNERSRWYQDVVARNVRKLSKTPNA